MKILTNNKENYICGYDTYNNTKLNKSYSTICIIKKDKIIYCTQKSFNVKVILLLIKLIGIKIIKETNK